MVFQGHGSRFADQHRRPRCEPHHRRFQRRRHSRFPRRSRRRIFLLSPEPTRQIIFSNLQSIMKSILTSIATTLLLSLSLAAAEPAPKELVAADDARVAATLAVDKAAMEKIFTDDLHYAHSSGVVDTKT